MYSDGVSSIDAVGIRNHALRQFGFPPQVSEIDIEVESPYFNAPTAPNMYHWRNWPKKLRLSYIIALGHFGYAMVTKLDGSTLTPVVPLYQLAQFLNNHVDGPVEAFPLVSETADPMWEELLPQLLNEVRPERFHFVSISLQGFFRHLSWPTIKRIFNSEQMMRTKEFRFDDLQLPRGVDPSAFLMELGAVRRCERFYIIPREREDVVLPRFPNAVLLEWLKLKRVVIQKEIELKLPRECLADGIHSLVALLKEDFASRRTRGHGYYTSIICPDTDLSGVREQTLFNRVTKQVLHVRIKQDSVVTGFMGRQVNSVVIRCE